MEATLPVGRPKFEQGNNKTDYLVLAKVRPATTRNVALLMWCTLSSHPSRDWFFLEGLKTKNMNKITFKKGKHRSNIDQVSITTGDLYSHFKGVFTADSVYFLQNNENQINKLFGHSVGLRHHHNNSARLGWVFNKSTMNVELIAYFYVNGVRSSEHLFDASLGEVFTATIVTTKESTVFEIFSSGSLYSYEVKSLKRKKYSISYKLNPYFGGIEPAPCDIEILYERLK